VYRDVPPGALALTRVEQVAVPGYAEKKRLKEEALGGKGGDRPRPRTVAE
jgi:hypothetical protein